MLKMHTRWNSCCLRTIDSGFLSAEFRFHNSTRINNNSSRHTNGFEWNNLKLDSGISRFKRQIQEIPKEASDHRAPNNSDDDESEENDKHAHAQNSFQNNVDSRVNKLLVRDDETTTSDSTSTTSSSTTTTVPTTTSSTTPTTSTTATSTVTTQSTTTTSTTSTTFPPITTTIPPTTATSTVTTTLPSTIIITTSPITTSTMTKTATSSTATTSSTTLAATTTTPKTTNIENVNTSTVITPTKSMTSTTQAADATPSFIEETSSVSITTQSSTSKPEKLVTSTTSFFNTSTKIALTSEIKDELTTIKKISRGATATIPSNMQTSSASPTTNESSTSIMTPIIATTNYNVSTTDTTIASTSKIQSIEKTVSSARVPNALKSSTMSTRPTTLKITTTSIIKATSSKENATSRMSTVTVTPVNTPSATKMSAIAKSLTAALTTSIPLNMKADNITENAIFVDINRSSSHNYSQTIQSDKILISTLESTELSPIVTSYASGQYHRTGAGSIPLDPIVPISTKAGRVVWNEQGQNEIGSTVPHNSSFVPLHHEKIVGMNEKHSISDQNRSSGNSEVGDKLVVANDIEDSTQSEQPNRHSQKIESHASFPWATAAIMVSGLLITISVCTAVVLYTQRSKAERESLREIRVGQVATPEFSTGTMRSG